MYKPMDKYNLLFHPPTSPVYRGNKVIRSRYLVKEYFHSYIIKLEIALKYKEVVL